MNVSLCQAAAALNANTKWQEMIADNLACSSIPGARKQDISFSAVAAGAAPGAVGSDAYVMPSASTSVNFEQGSLYPSGNPMDCAVDGPGFFEVQLPNGDHAYTRDGEFQLNAQGQLVTRQGNLMLGDGGPIQFDPNNASPITISATGQVSQGSDIKGHIQLVQFNQPGLLTGIGNGCFLANNPALKTTPDSTSQIRQGFLEGSNSTPTTQMASLITAMRMFEANQHVIQSQDDRMGQVINDLGNPS